LYLQSDAMVELLLRAIRFVDTKLNNHIIKVWHQILFPTPSLITPMEIGEYRNDKMQILLGRYGKQHIHYLAPGVKQADVTAEMNLFLAG